MTLRIWTVGHSSHSAGRLLELLEGQGIGCLVDVRSLPFSRRHPQYNRERLAACLAGRGIDYRWEGEFLGGRPDKVGRPDLCGPNGKPDWQKIVASEVFRSALDRLAHRAREGPTAILCAEEEPRRCHRLHLVSTAWAARHGGEVFHIRGDGRVETQREVLASLGGGPGEASQLLLFGDLGSGGYPGEAAERGSRPD